MRTLTQLQLDELIEQHELTWDPPDVIDGEIMPLRGKRLTLDQYDLSSLLFSNRDLRSCRLVDCNLSNADFSNSNISHAEFMRSDLRGANMNVVADSGTDYTGCIRDIANT
jgi:uncharacterized protein YjbI with pentapeptide repeats